MPGKSILITGCGSGIGLYSALKLKAKGYQVFATARKSEDVQKLAAQGLESAQLDVTDKESIQEALKFILTKTGGTLDALFNNAGFLQAGAIEDLSDEMIAKQFAVNVYGPLHMIQHVLPIMRQQGHGRIIQNSSILGIITIPFCGAYNASKFALEGFSNTLRQELRGTNIHISIINPGPIESRLRASAYHHYQSSVGLHHDSIYKKNYAELEKSYFADNQKKSFWMQTPDIIVKKLIHAMESRHPRAHYFPGPLATTIALLRRILPDFALDWVTCQSR